MQPRDRLPDLGELRPERTDVVAKQRDVGRELVLDPRQDPDALQQVVYVAAVRGQLANPLREGVEILERLRRGTRRQSEQIQARDRYYSPASWRASSSSRSTVSVWLGISRRCSSTGIASSGRPANRSALPRL